MMKRRVWVLALASVMLIGCGVMETGGPIATGEASFALTATGSSGAEYSLRDAIFEIEGVTSETLSSETDPAATVLTVDLPIGDYTVTLLAGWRMEVTTEAGTFDIDATLASDNPASFVIENEQVTSVVYVFEVNGEDVPFGDGTLEIGVDVVEVFGPAGNLLDPGIGWSEGASEPLIFTWNVTDLANTGEWEYFVYPQVGFTENGGPWGPVSSVLDEFEYDYEMAVHRVRTAAAGTGSWYWGCDWAGSCKPSNPTGNLVLIAYSAAQGTAELVATSPEIDPSGFLPGGELLDPGIQWSEGASEPLIFTWNATGLTNTQEWEYFVYPQVGFTENGGPWGPISSVVDEFAYDYDYAVLRVRPAAAGTGSWYWGCDWAGSCKPSNPTGGLALIAYSPLWELAIHVGDSGQVDTSLF